MSNELFKIAEECVGNATGLDGEDLNECLRNEIYYEGIYKSIFEFVVKNELFYEKGDKDGDYRIDTDADEEDVFNEENCDDWEKTINSAGYYFYRDTIKQELHVFSGESWN